MKEFRSQGTCPIGQECRSCFGPPKEEPKEQPKRCPICHKTKEQHA